MYLKVKLISFLDIYLRKKNLYTNQTNPEEQKSTHHECLDQLCNSPVQERAHIPLDSLYVFSVYTYQWKY